MAGTTRARKASSAKDETVVIAQGPVTEEASLLVPEDTETGIESYADVDWVEDGSEVIPPQFPEVKLIQGVSKMDEAKDHIGQFIHTDTGEIEDTFTGVPLHMQEQQAFFSADSVEPLCVAPNGEIPLPGGKLWTLPKVKTRGRGVVEVPQIPPQFCSACVFSQWGEDNERPECNRSVLLMMLREDNSIARFRIGGAAKNPFYKLVKTKFMVKGKRIPLLTRLWTFGAEHMTKGSQTWEQLTIETEVLPLPRAKALNEIARNMQADMKKASNEAVVNERAEDVIDGDGSYRAVADDIDDLPFE